MTKLTETVTIEREVTGVIADLVRFARHVAGSVADMTDAELVAAAREYWDEQHGED